MSRRPSSIFSFDTLHLGGGRPKGTLRVILLVALLVVPCELAARRAMAPIGRYWEYWDAAAAMKYEEYARRLEQGDPPDVVIIGDSTAARNIDPAAMRTALPEGTDVLSLAWPANYVAACGVTTVPLFDSDRGTPKVLVVSLDTSGLTDHPSVMALQQQLLSSPFGKHQLGDWVVADYCYLVRLTRARHYQASWWHGRDLHRSPAHDGYMPLDGALEKRTLDEIDPQGHSLYMEIDPERFEVFRRIGEIAQRRRFKVVIVFAPLFFQEDLAPAERDYLAGLEDIAAEYDMTLMNARPSPYLLPDHFWDEGHLNREGAKLFSQRLGQVIAPLLEGATDHSDE